jgi:hypothetical protein
VLKRTLAHAEAVAALSGDPTPTPAQMELKLVQGNWKKIPLKNCTLRSINKPHFLHYFLQIDGLQFVYDIFRGIPQINFTSKFS